MEFFTFVKKNYAGENFFLRLTTTLYMEKFFFLRVTECFGNWGYDKNSVHFTELYSEITQTVST